MSVATATSAPRFGLAMGTELLSRRLFGDTYEVLAMVPGQAVLPIATTFDEETLDRLAGIEVLITGWGAPTVTKDVLERLPRLRSIVHAAGSAHGLVEESIRDRVTVSTAGDINAIPVAEYSLAMILLACKQVFSAERMYRRERAFIDREVTFPTAGNYGQTVGIVGASRIGRQIIALLRPFSLRVCVYDPYLSVEEAEHLGVDLVGLEELLAVSDVVSLNAPLNPETTGMIGASELARMRDGTTLLNTARGGVVDHAALEREVTTGRIDAILDVTDPCEPLPADSVLWDCPNVILTPHVAGSMGTELQRMGSHAAEEVSRALRGEPFATPEPRPVGVSA